MGPLSVPPSRPLVHLQWGDGPGPEPPDVEPPTPGPNAAYATKNPASETPASITVFPVAGCRSSRERTNSPGTPTDSPFHSRMSPRRFSTAETESMSPRSVALKNLPRTTRTPG